jgi:lipoprotein-releasing system ATP-binding protein
MQIIFWKVLLLVNAVINLKSVSKVYEIAAQKVEALKDIDLSVSQGQLVAVCGKSGAGKSTLLHIIGTLDRPTSGVMSLAGSDVMGLSDVALSKFRNARIGFVFQHSNLLPEFSAIENVMIPGMIGGFARDSVRDRAAKLLAAVGLAKREEHRPGELSGGEQQRVAIARSLVMAPPIILADEPTGNLDLKTSTDIQELLLQLCHEHQITMMLVTHDDDLAARLPHRLLMEDGKITDYGGLRA